MKKYRRKIGDFATEYKKAVIFMAIVLISGVILGSVCGTVISGDKLEETKAVFEHTLKLGFDEEKTFILFLSALKEALIPLVLIWVFGFSMFFIPLTFVTVLVKGFEIGFSTGTLVRLFSVKGLGVSLGITATENMIFLPTLICLAVFSIQSAVKMKKFKRNKGEKSRLLVKASGSLFIILLISVICAVAESYVSVKIILPMII